MLLLSSNFKQNIQRNLREDMRALKKIENYNRFSISVFRVQDNISMLLLSSNFKDNIHILSGKFAMPSMNM